MFIKWILTLSFLFLNLNLCHSMSRDLFINFFKNPLIKLNRSANKKPKENIKNQDLVQLKNDVATVAFNQSIVVDVLANDQLPNNETFRIIHLSNISSGKADLILNGTKVKVTPELNSKIPVTFSYTVSDGDSRRETAKVFILVTDSSAGL